MVGNRRSSLSEFIIALEHHEQPLDIHVLTQVCAEQQVVGHLAICAQPYLSKILSGEKTIESRFGRSRSAPFGKVGEGDVILLKETAGPISALALVASVRCVGPLGPNEAEHIMDDYQTELQLEQAFKSLKKRSLYATLITFSEVRSIKPTPIKKADRRSWVVLVNSGEEKLLERDQA